MKQDSSKKTAGQQIADNLQKTAHTPDYIPVTELTEEMIGKDGEKYLSEVFEAIRRGKNLYPFVDEFYIEVLTKLERALSGSDHTTINQKFSIRLTCPSPACDQTVFFFNKKTENLTFLWSLPDQYTMQYVHQERDHLSSEYDQLIGFVWEFMNGRLLERAKKLCEEDRLQTGLITPISA